MLTGNLLAGGGRSWESWFPRKHGAYSKVNGGFDEGKDTLGRRIKRDRFSASGQFADFNQPTVISLATNCTKPHIYVTYPRMIGFNCARVCLFEISTINSRPR